MCLTNDNVVNTLLDVDKRSKDNARVRLDLKRMKIRPHLHIDESQDKPELPKALFYMSPVQKKMFCRLIQNARFPDGHASNMYNKVRLEENKLIGLKTHDCHIIMEELFPLAVMRTLHEDVAAPLVRLSNYFRVLSAKVINVEEIEKIEEEVPEILCQLEKIFPPSFFDIMEHLVIHLATEVRLAGPVQFRNMWSTEMFIGKLKGTVHTRSHPEGAIADEAYVLDECLTFCSRYIHGGRTKLNRVTRHDDDITWTEIPAENQYLIRLGKPLSACITKELDFISWSQAQRYVLFNYPSVTCYASQHKKLLSANKKRK